MSRGEAAQAISNALVRLLRDYTGRGPTQAYTTITVIDMRRRFQRTMKDDLVAAVEENTGREVLAFLSDHHIDPDIAVEIFILKPRAGADDGDGDGASGAGRDGATAPDG